MPEPLISVITPCEGREELVWAMLQSLAAARAATQAEVEVLLIDSSSGRTRDAIQSHCAAHGARYIEGPRNVRQKRNRGARCAQGRYLLFMDSDCVARADLFTQHLQAVAEVPPAQTGGSVGITEFVGPRTWVNRLAEASPFATAFSFAKQMPFCSWATTSNVMVSRSVFESVGGFDETLPFTLGGDDLDLTWRITLSGMLLKAAPEAVVFHNRDTWASLRAFASRVWRWGRVEHHLRLKHRARLGSQFPPALFWMAVLAFVHLLSRVIGWHRASGTSLVMLGTMTAAFVLEQCCKRIALPLRDWGLAPALFAIESLYRVGSWRESILRRRFAPPFRKIYFDPWHLRAETEMQAISAWGLLLAGLLGFVVS